MRFTIDREQFLKSLNAVGHAIAPKIAIAMLANYRIALTEKGLEILGSNNEISIRSIVPYMIGGREIIRAGILAVDAGQMEAARSLGLSKGTSMMLVVLPQAIKNILPALANELDTMVKESSICSVLGMAELMWGAKTVANTTYKTLSPYVLAALVYFLINFPASKAIEAIERRMRRGDRR